MFYINTGLTSDQISIKVGMWWLIKFSHLYIENYILKRMFIFLWTCQISKDIRGISYISFRIYDMNLNLWNVGVKLMISPGEVE